MSYRREPLNLADVLEEVCNHFRPRFASRGLDLINRLDTRDELTVFADPGRIFQLFSNVLENSCRYTDSPGFCEITLGVSAARHAVNETGQAVFPRSIA